MRSESRLASRAGAHYAGGRTIAHSHGAAVLLVAGGLTRTHTCVYVRVAA